MKKFFPHFFAHEIVAAIVSTGASLSDFILFLSKVFFLYFNFPSLALHYLYFYVAQLSSST